MPDLTPGLGSFIDTGYTYDATTHIVTSPFARIRVTTTATSVDVSTYRPTSPAFSIPWQIGVYVDGVYNQRVVALSGARTNTITFSAGTKIIDFVNGGTAQAGATLDDATLEGTWITNLSFNAAFTQLFPTSASKLLIYGDSITQGAGNTNPHSTSWGNIVRLAYSGQVSFEGRGAGQLLQDTNTAPKMEVFIAKVVEHAPSLVWSAIGVNDLGAWASAASFGTGYGNMLDEIHTALPNCLIVAQTPVLKQTEGALQTYRDAISDAVASRTSFVTRVAGEYLLDIATDYADTVHPNEAGDAKIADYVTDYLNGIRRFRITAS